MSLKANIGGIIPISTVDWYGKSSCVIFFNGCNFRCPYCQNYKLLDKINYIDIDAVKENIRNSADFVSSVVFSGGEPTIQTGALNELAEFSKRQGLLVGIETNGYCTSVLRKLVKKDLVDKIFLDIKTSPLDTERYSKITGGVIDANEHAIKSLKIRDTIIEARTTVFRSTVSHILSIAKYLERKNYTQTYVLQQGIPENAPEGEIRKERRITIKEMKEIANNISSLTSIKTKILEGKDI